MRSHRLNILVFERLAIKFETTVKIPATRITHAPSITTLDVLQT